MGPWIRVLLPLSLPRRPLCDQSLTMSSEKKPVGFATHLTAGGMAGAMEAVRTLCFTPVRRRSDAAHLVLLAMLSTSRHDQSANAALPFGHTARSTSLTAPPHRARLVKTHSFVRSPMTDKTTRIYRYRSPDRPARDPSGALQGSWRRSFGNRAKNVHSIR